jgi:hypothetical protein
MLDILSIDARIRKKFLDEAAMIPRYRKQIKKYKETLKAPEKLSTSAVKALTRCVTDLTKKIKDLETKSSYYFYLSDTSALVGEYRAILRVPVTTTFMGAKRVKKNHKKDDVVDRYLEVAKSYTDITVTTPVKKKIACTLCNSTDFDVIDDSIYICLDCGGQLHVKPHTSSFKDIDRINISSRYSYDRKIHFRDCIKQYQGKQNSSVDSNVYSDLEEQFYLHHLLDGTSTSRKSIRFRRITKEHVHIFLKDLRYTKHYENINMIFSFMTGKKSDDISHLEDRLLEDFDILTSHYDKHFKNDPEFDRKNFINTQYVLYQFLMRYRHKCNRSDFTLLKTMDRCSFHDEVCSACFSALGWNHTPLF